MKLSWLRWEIRMQYPKLDAVVVQCGIGKVNAALCVQILCDCFGVTHVVNTGIAGSLCAELDIGGSRSSRRI